MAVRVLAQGVLVLLIARLGLAQAFSVSDVKLPADRGHPFLACTPEELARFREAYRSKGAAHDAVAGILKRADRLLSQPVQFPPRGGQHNQWYQCDGCEAALKTVDDTHHQCPLCKKVYSGEPYDDVIFARKHYRNLSNMRTAAWAYAITGERQYAEYPAKILLGYADRYEQYPYHGNARWNVIWIMRSGGHLFEQTLTEASSLATTIAPAYDLIHDSGVLSEQDHDKIRNRLILPMLRNLDKNKMGKVNWQSWHNAAMFWGGALLGDEGWMRKAICDPSNGFLFQMRSGVTADGMWYENSWGYHFYTLKALTVLAEGARRVGIDLWGHPSLRKMFTLPVHYTMADGSLPRFADDVHSSARSVLALMEAAYHAYGDPAILGLLPLKSRWETVLYGRDATARVEPAALESAVFPAAGHAILRTKGEAGLTAAFTFGPYGGYHGHYDKLSFVFFGFGEELGVDPGRAKSQAYRLPIHKQWYKTTISHNAVLTDRKSQHAAAGKLCLFAANDQYAAVLAECRGAHPGVAQKRLLVMSPSYLLVFDDLTAGSEKRFDWVYHNRGTAVECSAASTDVDLSRAGPGFSYVKHTKAGTTDGPIRVRFIGDKVTTHLTGAAEQGTEVVVGDGPAGSVTERVPLVMIGRSGRRVRFAVVIEPVRKGATAKVSGVSLDVGDEAAVITIRRGDGTDVVTLRAGNRLDVSSNGKTVLAAPVGEKR